MRASHIGLLAAAAAAGFGVAITATGSHVTLRPAAAEAATSDLYVASSGNDANNCTASAPCKTLAHAYSVAPAGAVVHVAAGSYPLQQVGSSESDTKAATFLGDPG